MTSSKRIARLPCSRCRGRMLTDGTGDQTCFSCGNVIYSTELSPIALLSHQIQAASAARLGRPEVHQL